MSISKSQDKIVQLDGSSLVALLLVGLSIHVIYLVFNFVVAKHVLRLPIAMSKSVVIMCSQKTLPMAMTIVSFLPPEVGEQGLISIPCILSHLVQVFVDAFICARWANYTDTEQEALSPGDNSNDGGKNHTSTSSQYVRCLLSVAVLRLFWIAMISMVLPRRRCSAWIACSSINLDNNEDAFKADGRAAYIDANGGDEWYDRGR